MKCKGHNPVRWSEIPLPQMRAEASQWGENGCERAAKPPPAPTRLMFRSILTYYSYEHAATIPHLEAREARKHGV